MTRSPSSNKSESNRARQIPASETSLYGLESISNPEITRFAVDKTTVHFFFAFDAARCVSLPIRAHFVADIGVIDAQANLQV